ncbi:MAG: hypothetical protein ACLKAK_06185 [Alkaliphilus sp.]
MDLVRDLIYTNKSIAIKAFKKLYKNWVLIFAGLFYSLATLVLMLSLRFFWLLAGIVLIIGTSALISNYLHLLDCIVRRNKLTMQDFKAGFTVHLRKVWGIIFVFFIVQMGLDLLVVPILGRMIGPLALALIINFLVLILLNSLPEVIYQKDYNSWGSIKHTIDFVKENWIEWFVPNFFIIAIMYFLSRQLFAGITALRIMALIKITDLFSPTMIITYLISQVFISYFMIYRGLLFATLSTSTRRKRLFMREL